MRDRQTERLCFFVLCLHTQHATISGHAHLAGGGSIITLGVFPQPPPPPPSMFAKRFVVWSLCCHRRWKPCSNPSAAVFVRTSVPMSSCCITPNGTSRTVECWSVRSAGATEDLCVAAPAVSIPWMEWNASRGWWAICWIEPGSESSHLRALSPSAHALSSLRP